MENVKVFKSLKNQPEITNDAQLIGTITEDLRLSHEILGEKFYKTFLSVQRLSNETDILPITVSGRIAGLNPEVYKKDATCGIHGQLRSYNKVEDGKSRLILEIFVESTMSEQEAEELKFNKLENVLTLKGYVCKQPVYRKTPFNREICDVLMAVNRINSGKSDYIPCIVWGRNAQFMAKQDVGDRFVLKGRFQSRDYLKTVNSESIKKTAYEVSISGLEEWREDKQEFSNVKEEEAVL